MDLARLYRDIVETSMDGIWVIDERGRTLYANRRIAELLGRDPGELEHLSAFDAYDEVGRRQFADHLREIAGGEVTPQEVECLWVRKDGERLWVLIRENTLYDEHGHVQGYIHRVSDFSERRRLFDELSASRQMLAEAQRIAKVGSFEWDIPRDVITASDELHSLYGLADGFQGTYVSFLEWLHPDDRHIADEAVAAALAGADTFDFVVRVTRSDELAWMRGRGEVFRDHDGTPVLSRGTLQDVTDAKESELFLQDLVAQNTLMQLMASAANEAETLIELLSVAQPVLLQHDDWVRGRGFVPHPDHPDGLLELYLDPEEREADEAQPEVVAFERDLAVRAYKERAQVWDEETHPGRPSIAFPVMLGEEVVVIVLVITADEPFERHDMIRQMVDQVAVQLARVAERERAAKELAAARDGAMEASRQKSEFLATMSHEIRTPLNGVIGLTDLLLRTDLDAHQQRLASGTQVASRALLGVVNDILDFSKIESGKLELENVDFEVRPVFDQVASVLGESARSKGLELIVSCHPDVPEVLNGDPTRLGQVLTNLGSNAVKFTEDGEVFVRATAAQEPGGVTMLRVEVTDTGVGVDPGKVEHIFDPFSQADASTTREYGGTGLGLAISKEIVSALDGEIGVESTLGEGATFWFTARFGARRDAAGARTTATSEDTLAGRRVLVVDDNANNRLILSEHLGRWGAHPTTASSAPRALRLMRAAVEEGRGFDAVLLDMAMPEHDGMHLAARARDDERLAATPMILLTSSAQPDEEELRRVGIAECLTKPVLAGDVHDALLRALDGGEPAPRRTSAAAGPHTPPAADERPLLLVVEDNPVNQLVALGILETLGYGADTADDGLAAVEAWQRGSYAAVLMDVQMPHLDGYAATRRIRELEREEGRRTPVLAMTAAAIEGEREKCLAAGMDDFLTKPVNPDALGAMLRRWVRREGVRTAPSGPPPRDGVLDRDRLDMLRDLDPGNTAYLDKAIGNFVARVPESLDAVRDAVAAGDHEALTQAAHRLKGSALNLGLPAVGHVAYELELLGDSGAADGAAELLAALEEALTEAVAQVLGYQSAYRS
jgi:PAS domain S-box-containing protein